MAIFNEAYIEDFFAKKDNVSSLDESVIGTVATVTALTTVLVAGEFAMLIGIREAAAQPLKKAVKVFVEHNPECAPISDFKKKVFTIKPYTSEPDKESNPSNPFTKFLRKYKLDYGNKCICFFDKSGKLAMSYCYRNNDDGNIIKCFINNEKYKQFKDYYFSCMMLDCRWISNDAINWAKGVLSKYGENGKKK